MRRFRIYVDTSVIGGCFDPEFAEWSRLLVEDFRRRRLAPVLSDIVAAEIAPAPSWVRALHDELLAIPATQLMVTQDVIDLARAYRDERVLRERSWEDMLHVALASIARVDALAPERGGARALGGHRRRLVLRLGVADLRPGRRGPVAFDKPVWPTSILGNGPPCQGSLGVPGRRVWVSEWDHLRRVDGESNVSGGAGCQGWASPPWSGAVGCG